MRRSTFLMALLGFLVSPVASALAVPPAPPAPKADPQKDTSLRYGEMRTTLNPMQFRHPKIRLAYQAAKEIPWVLDSIFCFCFCRDNPNFRHKSLLSCYVDLHAAN